MAIPKPERVLIIGRSPGVLASTVALLRGRGYTADATTEFDHVVDRYDPATVDVVVFGGMVPPDTRQRLREQFACQHPDTIFVQGFAGIPGLIAAQVEAAVAGPSHDAEAGYEQASRSIRLRLYRPHKVAVVAWWATVFVPPEPQSTSMKVLDTELPIGPHRIPLPDAVPTMASFATVSIGAAVWAFIVGKMPPGTTMAQFDESAI